MKVFIAIFCVVAVSYVFSMSLVEERPWATDLNANITCNSTCSSPSQCKAPCGLCQSGHCYKNNNDTCLLNCQSNYDCNPTLDCPQCNKITNKQPNRCGPTDCGTCSPMNPTACAKHCKCICPKNSTWCFCRTGGEEDEE